MVVWTFSVLTVASFSSLSYFIILIYDLKCSNALFFPFIKRNIHTNEATSIISYIKSHLKNHSMFFFIFFFFWCSSSFEHLFIIIFSSISIVIECLCWNSIWWCVYQNNICNPFHSNTSIDARHSILYRDNDTNMPNPNGIKIEHITKEPLTGKTLNILRVNAHFNNGLEAQWERWTILWIFG